MPPDVIVVGAGIVGTACAEALSADGLTVLVVEADHIAAGATSQAMGHLVVMDDSPAQLALTTYARGLWAQRAPELPPSCEHDPCGTLWVASTDEELAVARTKGAFYAAAGVEARVLDAAALAAEEPSLRPGLAGGLLVTGDSVLYPPNAARHLLDLAGRRGATVREGLSVTALSSGMVVCGAERLEAGVVVNAAGALAPRLTPGLPVEPRKGHLVVTDRHPGFLRHQVVELGYLQSAHALSAASVAFNVQPRAGGQVLVGSSRELVGWDGSVNRSLVRRMLDRACAFMPSLARLSALRTWTGFRPATPDKLPLIGEWEKGLFVATGHEGLGITMALATGRLVADLIAGRSPAIDPAPYAPHRSVPYA